MRLIAYLALIAILAACSGSEPDQAANAAELPSREAAEVGDWKDHYPSVQPDGSPLDAEYCLWVGDQPGNPFDNIKTCVMIACDGGDEDSCEVAETYNLNLWEDGEPPRTSK